MICFPLFEGEQITQILLGLFLDIYFREYFSRRGWGVFAISVCSAGVKRLHQRNQRFFSESIQSLR